MITNPCTRTVCLHTANAGANSVSVSLVQLILAMSGAAATTATAAIAGLVKTESFLAFITNDLHRTKATTNCV